MFITDTILHMYEKIKISTLQCNMNWEDTEQIEPILNHMKGLARMYIRWHKSHFVVVYQMTQSFCFSHQEKTKYLYYFFFFPFFYFLFFYFFLVFFFYKVLKKLVSQLKSHKPLNAKLWIEWQSLQHYLYI